MKSIKLIKMAFVALLTVCLTVTNAYAADTNNVPQTVELEDYATLSDNLVVSPYYSSVDTTRIIKLRVLLDNAYRRVYGNNYMSEATTRVGLADYPFIETWRIGFSESFTGIINLPIDGCSRPDTEFCLDSVCGENCNNDYADDVHHKNGAKNLNKTKAYIKDSNYDIFMVMTATPLCYVGDGDHYEIYGVTNLNGSYAFITNQPKISTNVRVRIMQHEISHMFGCPDHSFDGTTRCIMNGGYDGISLYTKNVWCSDCMRAFDATKH